MTHLADLRAYLDALAALGDLKTVDRPVSADLEAAAHTRRSYELRAPAPYFTNIAEDRIGMRMFGAPVGVSSRTDMPLARLALSVGLPPDTGAAAVVDHLVRTRDAAPVPPRLVPSAGAPCKENVLLGDAATLDRFAIPRIHEKDGGDYLNTWGVIVAKTPDGAWTNWSITRIMKLDGKRMTGLVIPPQHLGLLWQAWAERGEPMPYALVQGGSPAIPFVAGIPLPRGLDEAGYIGALQGAPVDVVRCETSDLEVPAHAEVVIEGHLSVGRDSMEGPFGEYAGYASTHSSLQPVFSVEAITYRNEPVWPIVAEGRPADEYHTVTGTGRAANVLHALRAAGLPVTTVWMPFAAAMHWTAVTVPENWRSVLPGVDSTEFVRRIGEVMHNSGGPSAMMPVTFVLDDDVDPSNEADLLWALATRLHPQDKRQAWSAVVLPFQTCFTDEERKAMRGPSVLHDGLLPAWGEGRMHHASFAQAYPEEVRRKVVAHWDD
ncbi:UbiD family decarboxylase [Yinghuangia soli]|uniref:Pyrrole-2-carboxylic acid decarboxylase n=1 Tax=Yinghuangia soli TaxID=2908204 RepID=A0AA41Q029_9ACTN|nr:UbiD family decarboxylase [Yinghuangia soli]MCF2528836.1 UbiD family decarboxylase [Yinghuangia soli]